MQEATLQSIWRVVAYMSLGFLGILLMTVALGQCSDSSERLGGHWSTHTKGSFIIEAGAAKRFHGVVQDRDEAKRAGTLG